MFQNKPSAKESRNKAFNDYNRQQMRNEHKMTQMIAKNQRSADRCKEKSKELLRQGKRKEAEDQFKMMQMYMKENQDIVQMLDTQKMELVNLERGMRYSETADMSRASAVAFSKVAGSIHVKKIERTNDIRAKSKDSLDEKIGMLQNAHDEIRDEMLSAEQDDSGDGNGFSSFSEFAEFMDYLELQQFSSELEATKPSKPLWMLDIENAPDKPARQDAPKSTQKQAVRVSPDGPDSTTDDDDDSANQ